MPARACRPLLLAFNLLAFATGCSQTPPETLLPYGAVNEAEGSVYLYTSRSRLVKLDMGEGAEAPTPTESIELRSWREWNPPEGTALSTPIVVAGAISASRTLLESSETITAGALDRVVGHFYVYSFRPGPGRIVKIDMTTADRPTRVGHVDLDPGPGYTRTAGAAVIDPRRGYVLVGTSRGPSLPADILKVAATPDAQPPRIASTLRLDTAEANAITAVIDEARGYAYFGVDGANNAPARIVKVEVGDDDAPPRYVGAVVLDSAEHALQDLALIDAYRGFAFFGTATRPGRVVKIALGEGDALPTRVGAFELEPEWQSFGARLADGVVSVLFWLVGQPPGA